MRPGNIGMSLEFLTHEISNQIRFGLPCSLHSYLLYGGDYNRSEDRGEIDQTRRTPKGRLNQTHRTGLLGGDKSRPAGLLGGDKTRPAGLLGGD